MHRRQFLALAGSSLLGALPSRAIARAENWPERPVKLIIPYGPGGGSDLIGRVWAQKLSQILKQPFIVENRAGAGGMIGTDAAWGAPSDGYTFLMSPNGVLTVLPHLRRVQYDPSGFLPVARTGDFVSGFAIHSAVGPRTFKEMIEYAKSNPGKLSYGSAGLGTSTHLRLEMLKHRAEIDILHVPYRGSAEALNDLLPNTIQMMNEINNFPHIKANRLRLLNVNYSSRHWDFPDIPTLTEAGIANSDVPIWYAIMAPPGTPREIIDKFNAVCVGISNDAEVQDRLKAISAVLPVQTPEEISQFQAEDFTRNGNLIEAAGIRLE